MLDPRSESSNAKFSSPGIPKMNLQLQPIVVDFKIMSTLIKALVWLQKANPQWASNFVCSEKILSKSAKARPDIRICHK
jgi:hypothetical protein